MARDGSWRADQVHPGRPARAAPGIALACGTSTRRRGRAGATRRCAAAWV